jgi:hypothetical protein
MEKPLVIRFALTQALSLLAAARKQLAVQPPAAEPIAPLLEGPAIVFLVQPLVIMLANHQPVMEPTLTVPRVVLQRLFAAVTAPAILVKLVQAAQAIVVAALFPAVTTFAEQVKPVIAAQAIAPLLVILTLLVTLIIMP